MNSGQRNLNLRLIRGGKGEKAQKDLKIRLFSAYSIVDDFKGYDHVKLNWICVERRSPIAPYGKLIEGYAQISPHLRPLFEQYVNELFTEEEIGLLRNYLRGDLGAGFTSEEDPVPVSSEFIPKPLRQIKTGERMGLFKPETGGERSLPFDFCGCYDLGRCPPSLGVPPEVTDKGVEFLRESLRELDIDPAGYEPLFNSAVEKIYDEKGLMVEQGKTREERIRERSRFFRIQAPPES
jgi:hypothetical protein